MSQDSVAAAHMQGPNVQILIPARSMRIALKPALPMDRCPVSSKKQTPGASRASSQAASPRAFHIPKVYGRESSQIQFTSQVLPPSGENYCSIRADFSQT
jgi:hypothetical protein